MLHSMDVVVTDTGKTMDGLPKERSFSSEESRMHLRRKNPELKLAPGNEEGTQLMYQ